MMTRIIAALFIALGACASASAQGCGPSNPNCIVPDRPAGDSTGAAANTKFVTSAIATAVSSVSITCPAHQFVNVISGSGSTCVQPAFSDLSGSIAAGQIPNNIITNAMLAQAATTTTKCNPTGGTANLQDCTTTQLATAGIARFKLTGTTAFQVDSTNGNDSNFPGTGTGANAFLTLQGAINAIKNKVDINGQTWSINHAIAGSATAAGSYTTVVVNGPFEGDNCGGTITGAPAISISSATNATPIVVTTGSNHGYTNGDAVSISGVASNSAANGVFTISGVTATPLQLVGTTGTGSGTGGSVTNITKVAIAGSTPGTPSVNVINGGCIAVQGFNITNTVNIDVGAWDKGTVTLGRNQYGQAGSAVQQIWGTRHGYVTLIDNCGISSTGTAMFNFIQASHQGQARLTSSQCFLLSNITYDNGTGFLYSDYGDITTTASPSATPFLSSPSGSFTVTGKKWTTIENGMIQVEGSFPPSNTKVLGSINGTAAFTSALSATSYTPAISSGTGTITTATATGFWWQVGMLIWVEMTINITNNGTGATSVIATLPFPVQRGMVIIGKELGTTGKTVSGASAAGSSNLNIVFYDNTYPGGAGANVIVMSGVYEMQP